MLRATWLTVQNEARLLLKDPVVLLMLLLAPIVIIAVAGYSLGDIYGNAGNAFIVPVVDLDRGEVAAGIIEGLRHEPSITVEQADNPDDARKIISHRERAPIAIEIPPGTSAALTAGHQAQLIIYVDPVKRIEANALEVRIGELCRKVTEQAQAAAQKRLAASQSELQREIERLSTAIKQEQTQVGAQMDQARAAVIESIRAQTAAAIEQAREQTTTIVRMRENEARSEVQRQLSDREAILRKIQQYLLQLKDSQRAFESWVAQLKTMAGSHAADIPPPPAFPAPPSDAELAELSKPIAIPKVDPSIPALSMPNALSIKIPKLPAPRGGKLLSDIERFRTASVANLPGNLGFVEKSASGAGPTVNAFDQYVPGFGITFLLIGMMLGVSLTLFDERDWGTLKRLQVGGAPLASILIGKLIARFMVGTLQMVLLFAVGWALFGISLGRAPLALLMPTMGISFAAAALGLVIASIARAHDTVMPLGTMTSMALSALGGCWWPLDFEPAWMRELAKWLPTTWTMQAYNDLMIRNLPPSAVLWPFAATVGLGLVYLAAGIFGLLQIEE